VRNITELAQSRESIDTGSTPIYTYHGLCIILKVRHCRCRTYINCSEILKLYKYNIIIIT